MDEKHINEIHKDALATYKENMEFLKETNNPLFKRLNLLETALNTNLSKPKYDLEYKDGYFDILNLETNTYIYNQNSETYGKDIVDKHLDYNAEVNSFKTFYGVKFTNDLIESTKNATMFSDTQIGNAPIIHYVNENLPEKQNMKTIPKLIIFGVGVGSHIPYIQMKVKPKIYLIVEPNLEIFRLSLFTIKYANLAKMTKLVLSVGENESQFINSYNAFYNQGFIYNHYFKLFMFNSNSEFYTNIIQNQLVSQTHIVYAYNRLLNGLSKTVDYIDEQYQFLNILPKKLDFLKKPILFLGAGPNLQRNIEFVKENQDKYIIVALYVTLPLLEKNEIVPDIVTQYDEGADIVYNVIKRIEDVSFFENTLFVFASHVDKRVMETFPKENVFVFQAMYDLKIGFGAKTAPSIGELTYSLLLQLGAENITMLGIDMAMDVETNKTHIDGHASANIYKNFKKDDNRKHNLKSTVIQVKGNFLPTVDTLPLYKMSINSMNTITRIMKQKHVKVYNLSNGAYFENTIPLKMDEIDFSKFNLLDKSLEKESIKETFQEISDVGFNDNDKKVGKAKVEEAERLKKELEEFLKVKKDSSLEVYERRLGAFIDHICFQRCTCTDLQSIIKNYIMHNAHYMYHLINMQGLNNPKRHVKYMNRYFCNQISKIIKTYLEILEKIIKEEV